ncbi:ABC transporter substrate-binding protein [Pseudalkalibacillus sp. SCS-8]|uniref:ABC transporter substrate-binding protein n=1 Tax=Pseudalkalibacillus nanhaiensis TaxID=3115291 RepID=UPI0032D9E136
MREKKLFTFILVALLSFALMIAGCSNSKETSSEEKDKPKENKPSENSGETVTITYGTWQSDEEVEKIIKAFEETHPNIKVKKDKAVTWPWNEKLSAAAAAGKLPDVFWTFGVPTAVTNGWLEDLTPYLEADEEYDPKNTFGSILETAQYEGRQYAMPHSMHAIVMLVNTDLFEKENVPVPDSSWTLDDLRKTAVKMTNFNEHQFGFENPRAYREALPSQFDTSLEWGTWDGEQYNFSSAAYVDAQNYINTLWQEDKVSPFYYEQKDRDKWYGKDKHPWNLGKVAMKYDGTWGLIGNTENNKFNWSVLPVPGMEDNRVPLVADYMGISKSSEHKEAAYEFMKWLTFSKEGWLARKDAGVPVAQSIPIVNDKEIWETYLGDENVPEGMKEIIKGIPNGTVDPLKFHPGYTEVLDMLGPMNEKFDKGEAKPSDVGAELDEKANEAYQNAVQKLEEVIGEE